MLLVHCVSAAAAGGGEAQWRGGRNATATATAATAPYPPMAAAAAVLSAYALVSAASSEHTPACDPPASRPEGSTLCHKTCVNR